MLTPFLILAAFLFLGWPAVLQEQEPGNKPETAAPAPAPPAQTPIPAEAANTPNPVHPSPESQSRAKQIYSIDCALCHGQDGSGKGDVAMTAKMADFRDPASLKGLTDGQIFYIVKNGRGDMPPGEASRAKTDETWNLVIYLTIFLETSSGKLRLVLIRGPLPPRDAHKGQSTARAHFVCANTRAHIRLYGSSSLVTAAKSLRTIQQLVSRED